MMATYRLLEWMALCGGFVPCALLKGVEQPEAMDGWHPVHRGHLAERMVDDPYFHTQRLGVASRKVADGRSRTNPILNVSRLAPPGLTYASVGVR